MQPTMLLPLVYDIAAMCEENKKQLIYTLLGGVYLWLQYSLLD